MLDKTSFVLCCFLVIVGISCDKRVPDEGFRTMNQEETSTDGYYYEMPENELRIFIKKAQSVGLTDSVEKVKEILGPPTYEDDTFSKKGEFLSHMLKYQVKKWERKGVNIKHDQKVSFDFNENDSLFEISSNVDGMPSRKKGERSDYAIPVKDSRIFIEKVKEIKLNDSVDRVKTILGQPPYDYGYEVLDRKGKGPFSARSLKYHVENNGSVKFYFDSDQLFEISSNVEGIPSRKRADE
jgi:hypothetical protein